MGLSLKGGRGRAAAAAHPCPPSRMSLSSRARLFVPIGDTSPCPLKSFSFFVFLSIGALLKMTRDNLHILVPFDLSKGTSLVPFYFLILMNAWGGC